MPASSAWAKLRPEEKRAGAALLVSLVFAAFVACSNSEEAAPSRTVVPAGSTTSSSGSTPDAAVDPSCQGAEGCFSCEPARSIDLLNACTDGTCTPFDNTRLPLFTAGQPLPPVP
jgi:hypothetical protein